MNFRYRTKMWFVLFLLPFFFAFFLYDRKKHNFWQNLGVPSLPPYILLGNLKNFIFGKKSFSQTCNDVYKSFPDQRFVGIYEFYRPRLLIRDPELVNQMLVTDFGYFMDRMLEPKRKSRLSYHLLTLTGQKWKAVRSKLAPTFSSNKLKLMYDLIYGCTELLDSHVK